MLDRIKTHISAQKDFWFFITEILGIKECKEVGFFNLTPVHKELCDFLQHSPKQSKMVLKPRYSFKSAICTAGYSLWKLVKNPNLRILIYSDSAGKASGFLTDIKNHIEGKAPNSRFREFYPNWETDPHKGKWNESEIIVSTRDYAHREPSIDTGGIDSSKVGKHYDIIIFDDIVSDINCTTKQQMDKIHDCYKKALSLLKPGGEVVIVGTRWHYGDCYGRILAENRDRQNFGEFIKDAEEVDSEGKLIFESIGLNREFLDYQRKEQGSYIYSCLYRNNPVSDDTALFKIEDFRYYDPTPEFHKNFYITATCDPAGEGEDFTAITVIGMDSKRNLYVLDAVNKHLKPSGIVSEIIKLSYKWKFRKIGIETNFFKGTLEADLKRARDEERSNQFFESFGVEPLKATSKQTNRVRILALQPFHERGQFYLPGKDFNSLSQVYSELAFQMIQYTIDGSKSPHDDLVVALGLQTEIMHSGGEAKKEGPPETSAAHYEKQYFKTLNSSKVPRRFRQNLRMAFN